MTRSFGLDAPSALEALKTNMERIRGDDLNEDLARDCACKAWHLCEHVFKALGSNSQFPKLKDLKDHVRRSCPELGYLQDICNESKHGEITRYTPRINEAEFRDGDFSPQDFDPHDFDVPRLEIELLGGQTVFLLDVVDRAVGFWSDFFEGQGIT